MKSLYITSVEHYSGKTATCLAIGNHLRADGFQVGYLKPLSLQPFRIGKKVADMSPGAREIARLARKVIREMRSLSAREVEVKVGGFSKADIDLAPFMVGDFCKGALISIRESLSLAEREDASFDSLVYLIGTIAHEIKNPLGGIKGAAQLLKGRLLLWDGMHSQASEVCVERNPSCPVCGTPRAGRRRR